MVLLVKRYKVETQDKNNEYIEFLKFIKDMEFCDQGISPALIWATDLAEDIMKGLIMINLTSPE